MFPAHILPQSMRPKYIIENIGDSDTPDIYLAFTVNGKCSSYLNSVFFQKAELDQEDATILFHGALVKVKLSTATLFMANSFAGRLRVYRDNLPTKEFAVANNFIILFNEDAKLTGKCKEVFQKIKQIQDTIVSLGSHKDKRHALKFLEIKSIERSMMNDSIKLKTKVLEEKALTSSASVETIPLQNPKSPISFNVELPNNDKRFDNLLPARVPIKSKEKSFEALHGLFAREMGSILENPVKSSGSMLEDPKNIPDLGLEESAVWLGCALLPKEVFVAREVVRAGYIVDSYDGKIHVKKIVVESEKIKLAKKLHEGYLQTIREMELQLKESKTSISIANSQQRSPKKFVVVNATLAERLAYIKQVERGRLERLVKTIENGFITQVAAGDQYLVLLKSVLKKSGESLLFTKRVLETNPMIFEYFRSESDLKKKFQSCKIYRVIKKGLKVRELSTIAGNLLVMPDDEKLMQRSFTQAEFSFYPDEDWNRGDVLLSIKKLGKLTIEEKFNARYRKELAAIDAIEDKSIEIMDEWDESQLTRMQDAREKRQLQDRKEVVKERIEKDKEIDLEEAKKAAINRKAELSTEAAYNKKRTARENSVNFQKVFAPAPDRTVVIRYTGAGNKNNAKGKKVKKGRQRANTASSKYGIYKEAIRHKDKLIFRAIRGGSVLFLNTEHWIKDNSYHILGGSAQSLGMSKKSSITAVTKVVDSKKEAIPVTENIDAECLGVRANYNGLKMWRIHKK